VAAQLGFRDWNTTSAALNSRAPGGSRFICSIPVLLSPDEATGRKFYCDFLGFEVEFEHRFAADMPVYLGLRRGPVQLHLSPHRGDATAGSAVFVWMTGLDDYRRELATRSDGHSIPEVAEQTWGREITLTAPFGNRLRFCEQPAHGAAQMAVHAAAMTSSDHEISGDADIFAVVREIGAELPGVKVTRDRAGTALRMAGEIIACTAIHKSAEPGSLMIRLGSERRDALMAENPDVFYLTKHYEPYPAVLVRLSRISGVDLRPLLKEAWEFVRRQGN
jgi:hypothetical protein